MLVRPNPLGKLLPASERMRPLGFAAAVLLCVFYCYARAYDPCDFDSISDAISSKDLSKARYLALESLKRRCSEAALSELYQEKADQILGGELFHQTSIRVQAPADEIGCWTFSPGNMELWDECCSEISAAQDDDHSSFLGNAATSKDECYRHGSRTCCDFYEGSSSYLRLPALRELALRVRLQTDDGREESYNIELEQDGFLRRFDAAGILWPTGYLLALCVAAPRRCGAPELYNEGFRAAVEIGAGIGAPSLALALFLERQGKSHPVVVAADKARQALALAASNAHAANVSSVVTTYELDHYNKTAVENLVRTYGGGFSIVLGSSLQALFDESTQDGNHHLWALLDMLASEDSIVLLAHTIHSLQAPVEDGMFERIRVISGDQLGMKTRWGKSSDFEISMFRRKAKISGMECSDPTELEIAEACSMC